MDNVNLRITNNQAQSLQRDLSLDLIALFNVLENEINEMIQKAIKENWTPDELINKIEILI